MKIFKHILFTFVLFILLIPNTFAKEKVNIYLFYGKGCPHCEQLKEKLEYLKKQYPIKVYMYEIWYDSNNSELATIVADKLNTTINGVPFTVLNNTSISGYSSGTTVNLLKYNINMALNSNDEDMILSIGDITNSEKYSFSVIESNDSIEKQDEDINEDDINQILINIPIINKKINLKSFSLPIVSIIMGAIDGFNPCAMWILLFLISMLITMKNKKKRWILGLTFLTTSAIVYLLFMVAWLNFTTFIQTIPWIKILIALVAIIGGFLNLWSFIKTITEDDGCTIVDEKKRKKYFTKIKDIINNKSFIFALIGIMILAASVNIVELACSAGLPVAFTSLLASNNLSTFSYMIYILIYILFFLLDDIIIFVISMKTLEVTGVSTKYGKLSHLIGGIIMIIIGALMIFKPEWLMFG